MTGYERSELPMFPLGTVLLPGGAFPLHVFEPRYRALARHCVDNDVPFGVVLIERGSEVGGGDVRTAVGCLARIVEHEELPDGRWAIIAAGETRVRIDEWLSDDPYPRALVTSWPDDPDVLDRARRDEAVRRVTRVMAMASEAGYQVPELDLKRTTMLLEDSEFTLRLAASIPVGALDRQRLLSAAGPSARLDVLDDVMEGVEIVVMTAIQDAAAGDGPGDASDDPSSGML